MDPKRASRSVTSLRDRDSSKALWWGGPSEQTRELPSGSSGMVIPGERVRLDIEYVSDL